MLQLLSLTAFFWSISLILLIYVLRFLKTFHANRSLLNGLPQPPGSYLFGHLVTMGKVVAKQPPNAAPQTFMHYLKQDHELPDAFYFNPWPMGPPVMAIYNVDMLNEITVKSALPKHPIVEDFMKNFGGPGNLVSTSGVEWKKWRSAFNPGFSSSHLMAQVPVVVEECKVFCKIMANHATQNRPFRMEQATTKLTVNIIGKIILDVDLNAQHGRCDLVDAFNSQVRWQKLGPQFQPSELWDIRRPIIQRWNNWKMNQWIGARLDERFARRTQRQERSRHVVDLAFEAYLKEVKRVDGDTESVESLDQEFKQAAISNMKTFVFAGHDTTSSTICYAFYYLSKHPEALSRIRAEHDEVFGVNPTTAADTIVANSSLINKLEYTLAVTKEVLRLQPPASTVREGQAGHTIRDPTSGRDLPTEGFMLWPVNVGIHRNSRYWPDPHTFNPDRFMPSSPDYALNNKEAWIPFSKGPRNCIGQELAIIETKVILAMTVRTFDFRAAYEESESEVFQNDGSGYPNLTKGVVEQFGERAYQVQLGTAKPAEGMPCRITLAKR